MFDIQWALLAEVSFHC